MFSSSTSYGCFPVCYVSFFSPSGYFFFLNKFVLFIYLFMAALGLRCCTQALSRCGEQGLFFVVVRGLLFAVDSPVAEHGL